MTFGKPMSSAATRNMAASQQRRRDREQSLKGTSFDPQCYHLAQHFLEGAGSPREHVGLAQHIQGAVEAWFQTRLEAYEPCLSPAEQEAQGARCGCRGADDYCGCQNVPDTQTRKARATTPQEPRDG